MVLERNIYSANIAISFIIKALGSNKSERVSVIRSFCQVADIQVKIPKTILKGTASRAIARILANIFTIKKLKEYIDTAKNNLNIDLNYSPKQQIIELSNSDEKTSPARIEIG